MSSPTPRRPLQRLGLVGVGSALLLVGIASAASAATDVSIPLAPPEVVLGGIPIENVGGVMDPMAGTATPTPVQAEYGDDLTITLPTAFDSADAVVELVFEDVDGDGTPDQTYSTELTGADELIVAGQGTQTLTITLPADDAVNGPVAELRVTELSTGLGAGFTVDPLPLSYLLTLDGTGIPSVALAPSLLAVSSVPCAVTSTTPCPILASATAGSTVTLELPTSSLLRTLGLTDLTGVVIGLQPLDADGLPVGAAVELTAQVSGSTATFVVPAGTAAGSYGLVVVSPLGTTGISILAAQLTVVAPEAVVAPPAAPNTPTPPAAVNAGLRSNTGAEAVETGSTSTLAVAAGAGMLLVAGVGGVAVARTRRRPAVEGGTCGA